MQCNAGKKRKVTEIVHVFSSPNYLIYLAQVECPVVTHIQDDSLDVSVIIIVDHVSA